MMWDVPREISQFVLRKNIVSIALKQTLAMAGLVGNKNIKRLDVYTYGSVSAGREKWPFNVLFFLKVEPPYDQT